MIKVLFYVDVSVCNCFIIYSITDFHSGGIATHSEVLLAHMVDKFSEAESLSTLETGISQGVNQLQILQHQGVCLIECLTNQREDDRRVMKYSRRQNSSTPQKAMGLARGMGVSPDLSRQSDMDEAAAHPGLR